MPGLQDAMFSKSVVYLCEHSARGALGLVINKPFDIDMRRLFEKVDQAAGADFYRKVARVADAFLTHETQYFELA